MENGMKNIKIFFMFVGLLSFSTVQAATYTATGSSTTYTTSGSVSYNGGQEYTTYTTSNSGTGLIADELLASDGYINSGNEEKAFLNAVLGTSYSWDKTEMDTSPLLVKVLASGVNAVDVTGFLGGYFMLKFGDGDTQNPDDITRKIDSHWIFKNTPNLDQLVWLAAIQDDQGTGRLSHFTICTAGDACLGGGTGTGGFETPIPAAIWLFGSALFGLMGVSRKQKTMVA